MNTKQVVKEIISEIPVLPYEWEGYGVTTDIEVSSNITLKKSKSSYCSGAVFEFLYRLLCKFKKWDKLKKSAREELYRYCYVRTDLDDSYFWGLPEGLVQAGLATEVRPALVDESGIFFGQLYDWEEGSDEPILGHAVVCIKQWKNKGGKPAIWTFSADNISLNQTGEDYWSIDHPRKTRERQWCVAQLDTGWLEG